MASIRVRKGNRVLKVVLLGDGGVGKSSLMNVFVHKKFDPQSYHTIGVEFLTKEIKIEREIFTLQIWDTAGQERFKSLRTPFYRGSDCCMLTFGVDDDRSFKNLTHWHEEFVYYADISNAGSFPFVVIGNKIDVPESKRTVTSEEAKAWCTERNMPYYETSAKDAVNVDNAFHAVVCRAQELENQCDNVRQNNMVSVDLSQRANERSTCC